MKRVLLTLTLLACVVPLRAQIGGGSVVGSVIDPSGAAIPAASINIRNLATNAKNQTTANADGYYEFPLLPAGRYVLTAEHPGFRTVRSAEFELNSGTRPRIDLTLAVGSLTESIDVVATAPLVNATTTDLGVVVTNSKVESLPLNGRNFEQLVSLQAGVVDSPGSTTGGRGGIEFHGSPALGNNLLLDGVDMSFGENNASASDRGAGSGGSGALINTVSVDAIEEFKASGSAFSAEYGRSTGGVLNVTTKSGTNRFHGTAFEYFRNDALDANSFFSNRSALAKPALRWNQFGGNFGGPLRRDRIFFFGNYEGAKVKRPQQMVVYVPTPALLDRLTPAMRKTMEYLPKDFEPTSDPLVGLHRRNDARKNDEHTFFSRVDSVVGNHRLATRYNYNRQEYSTPGRMLDNRLLYPTRFHNALAQDSWTISPTLFNEFRFGFNRMYLDRHNSLIDVLPARIAVAGVDLNSDSQARLFFMTNTYTFADNLSQVRGRHSWKAGFEIRAVRSNREQATIPSHNYDSIADMIADKAATLNVQFGNPGNGLSSTNFGAFIQDEWRATRRLQINLGLRYEYYTPIKGAFNVLSSDPFGPYGTRDDPMCAPDRNNFGPRAGLVFDLLGNQKLVMRAGGGITYAPPQPMFFYDMSFISPLIPFSAALTPLDVPRDFNTAYPFPAAYRDAIIKDPSLLPKNLVLGRGLVDYNRRDEYAGQWNFSLQSAVTRSLSLQGSYVGSRGLKLLSLRLPNLPDPATRVRPRPDLGSVVFRENAGNSSYHAFQFSANQRLNHGLTLDVYYTFGKTLSYYASDGSLGNTENTVQDQNNIAGSYGPKDSDVRHLFTTVVSYAVPSTRVANALLGGWTVQAILSERSGMPVNVLAGRDMVGNTRLQGQRPDLLPGVPQYADSPDGLLWLNRGAFDIDTPTRLKRFGNLGYNALRGPSAFSLDAALHKTFTITEGHRLTFRAEAFNAFNHKRLGNPVNSVVSPTFGTITSASGGRNVQLALKYVF